MSAKSATSRLSSFYSLLWGIPLPGDLLNLALLISLIGSITIIHAGGYGAASFIIIPCYILSVSVNWFVKKLGLDLGSLNFRRMNQLLIVNMIFLIIGNLMFSFTGTGLVAFTIFATVSAFIRVTIYLALAGKQARTAYPFIVLAMAVESIPPACFLSNQLYGFAFLRSYVVGGGLAVILTLILDKLVFVSGISIWKHVTSVLAVLLDGRNSWLEEIGEQLDEEAEIKIDMFSFRREGEAKPELMVLVPTFHPGPFKNFGSSELMYRIADELKSMGIETIFFKGLSNHETNVVAVKDREHILRKVLDEARRFYNAPYKSSISSPKIFREDDARGLLFSICGLKLLFLTSHPIGMEDIPPSIMKSINDDHLIPVDAHNSFSEEVRDLSVETIAAFSKILKRASETTLNESQPMFIGYARSQLDQYSLEDGIGGLGVSALVIGSARNLAAIIVLDGNNCLPTVRDKIIERLKPLGFKEIEVLTTDTHIVNGLKFGGRGYHPLGEVIPAEELAEKSHEAVKKALRSVHPAEVAWTRLSFNGVKVMSSSFLEEAAVKAYRSLAIFLAFFAMSFFAGVIHGLLLAC